MTDTIHDVVDALQRELTAPVRGEVIVRIAQAIDFSEAASAFIEKAAAKLGLTRADGQIHDFMFLLPQGTQMVGVRCLVHPGTIGDGAAAAKDDLFAAARYFGPTTDLAAIFHVALFAGHDPIELRCAWLPLSHHSFDDPDLANLQSRAREWLARLKCARSLAKR